jgi:hypothetical protein
VAQRQARLVGAQALAHQGQVGFVGAVLRLHLVIVAGQRLRRWRGRAKGVS